jgi:hemolysin D
MSANFDQPIILRRSPTWSRAIVWGLIGATTFGVIWASVARLDEAVSATGQLQPTGSVRDIRVPINGVVETLKVKDGDRVDKGDVLLKLDQDTAKVQIQSLKKVRDALVAENRFYRQEMNQTAVSYANSPELKISPEMAALTKSRAEFGAENALYRSQLTGNTGGATLTAEQQLRLQSSLAELETRKRTAQLEAEQLERQLAQNQVQMTTAQEIFKINDGIFKGLEQGYQAGAIGRVQYLRQQQEVKSSEAKVLQLVEEKERLRLAIDQAQQKLQNTVALSQQDVLAKIATNDKQIAEIDTQINKAIVENDKKIAELDSQIKQAEQTFNYQEIRSPVDGVVFDLKASGPGYVATTSEPVLKVVPEDALTVEVYLSNKDIGFVKEGMDVDVRVDSFPFSEFGDIKGKVTSIGSDALPETQVRPFPHFPVKIKIDKQTLYVQGKEKQLQSGMSISANIKTRSRTVMSIFTESFSQKVDSFKSIR